MVSITDPVKKNINFYSLDSIINPNARIEISYKIELEDTFQKTRNILRRPLILSNQIIDLRTFNKDSSIGMFNFYSLNGVFQSKGGEFPNIGINFPDNELINIYIGGINNSDDSKYLIWNYYNLDLIDLYDKNGNLKYRAYGPDGNNPEYEEITINDIKQYFPTKNSHFGYSGLAKMRDSSIFVLYNGLSVTDGEYHCKKIFKFNDKLKPKIIYNLDIPIFDFDISWDTKQIYGIAHSPKTGIIIYKF